MPLPTQRKASIGKKEEWVHFKQKESISANRQTKGFPVLSDIVFWLRIQGFRQHCLLKAIKFYAAQFNK